MPLRPVLVVLITLSFVPVFASSKPKSIPNQNIDRIVANERALGNTIRNYSPMVETYLQRMQPDNALGFIPSEDHYFLGRVQFQQNKEEFPRQAAGGTHGGLVHEVLFHESDRIRQHDFRGPHRFRPQELHPALHEERVPGRDPLPVI